MECYWCGEKIDEKKQQFCSLVSFTLGKECARNNFHRDCWSNFLNNCVENRVKQTLGKTLKQIQKIVN